MNSKIRKIYIHAGVMKTATSSLQQSLFKSRKTLKNMGDGYLYPQVSYFHHGRFILSKFTDRNVNPRTFVRKFHGEISNVKEYSRREQIKFENELLNTDCANVIISSEIIPFLDREELLQLKKYLRNLAPRAEFFVVICTREHTSHLASKVQQNVRVSMPVQLDAEMEDEFNYYQKNLTILLENFDRDHIIVYKFEDIKLFNKGPIELFFRKINADVNYDQLINFRINEGLSGLSVDILMNINNKVPLVVNNRLAKGRIFFDDRILGRFSGEKYLISKRMIEEIHEKSKKDKVWLKENLSIDYTNIYQEKSFKRLNFDKTYKKEFKHIFIALRPTIQKLCYDYVREKILSNTIDNDSRLILQSLKFWMERLIPDLKNQEINFFLNRNHLRYSVSIIKKFFSLLFFSQIYSKRFGSKKLFEVLFKGNYKEVFR